MILDINSKFEQDVGHRSERQDVPTHQLCDDVQPDMLIRDTLQQTLRNEIDHGDGQSDNQPPSWEPGVPTTHNSEGKTQEHNKQNSIPPIRHLGVVSVQSHVDIVSIDENEEDEYRGIRVGDDPKWSSEHGPGHSLRDLSVIKSDWDHTDTTTDTKDEVHHEVVSSLRPPKNKIEVT
ncbi:hypothetical protein WICPIJ_000400 [Wickerhamomyces pijperi]|uniref:Uncharacterized protein n=1 Tax=Wickerhamomyces pijperi TaxID=599730 RepID=A0A9P8QDL5_WICPI|nr:hypothetical protein WICPIJ_000400 [Wickerhamomyces pijperi]